MSAFVRYSVGPGLSYRPGAPTLVCRGLRYSRSAQPVTDQEENDGAERASGVFVAAETRACAVCTGRSGHTHITRYIHLGSCLPENWSKSRPSCSSLTPNPRGACARIVVGRAECGLSSRSVRKGANTGNLRRSCAWYARTHRARTAAHHECSMLTSVHETLRYVGTVSLVSSVSSTPWQPESGQNLASDNATLHRTVHLAKCDRMWPLSAGPDDPSDHWHGQF